MRIVIVGAGVTGLSASIFLARSGHDVTVVEKSARPAPLLRGFTREGLHFDTGFHIGGGLQAGGALHTWLSALGVMPLLTPVPLRTDSSFLFTFPDGTRCSLPCGKDALCTMMAERFPGHEHSLATLLHDMDTELQGSAYMNPLDFRLSPPSFPVVEPSADKPPYFWVDNAPSLVERLALLPPELATMLASFTLLYGVPSQNGLWKQFSVVVAPFLHGTHTLMGGGKSLARALEFTARKAGVRLLCGQAVDKLDVSQDKKIQGVRLEDGSSLECEVCLFTGHPAQLSALVEPGVLRPAYLQRLTELEETGSPLLLFAQTRSDHLDSRTLFLLADDTSPPLFRSENLHSQVIYVACGDPHADGRRPLMVATQCPPMSETTPYHQTKRALAAALADEVRRRCPELHDLRVVEAATPHTMRRWIFGSTGSLYGIRHDMHSAELQPATRVKGLLLAGQNILLPGILGCVISAAVAVGLIAGPESVFKECLAWAKSE